MLNEVVFGIVALYVIMDPPNKIFMNARSSSTPLENSVPPEVKIRKALAWLDGAQFSVRIADVKANAPKFIDMAELFRGEIYKSFVAKVYVDGKLSWQNPTINGHSLTPARTESHKPTSSLELVLFDCKAAWEFIKENRESFEALGALA